MGFRPAFADLSHHNSISDSAWAQAKSAGLVGVILKASEGTTYKDSDFVSRVTKAKNAGLLVAAYHYLKKSSPMREQMQFFVSVAKPAPGNRLVIDFEESGLTGTNLIDAVKALKEFAPECEISVYGGQSFLNETLGRIQSDVLAATSLWVARYTSAGDPGTIPSIWPTWTAWQYTDGSAGGNPKSVPGFGNCDLNEFNGSPENCAKWFYVSPTPQPEPEPGEKEVAIDITAPAGVTVTVRVNGNKIG